MLPFNLSLIYFVWALRLHVPNYVYLTWHVTTRTLGWGVEKCILLLLPVVRQVPSERCPPREAAVLKKKNIVAHSLNRSTD